MGKSTGIEAEEKNKNWGNKNFSDPPLGLEEARKPEPPPPLQVIAGGDDDEDYICECVQLTLMVGRWKKSKDGRRRKIRQINFNPVVVFASEDANDTNAWGDQIERNIAEAEKAARNQILLEQAKEGE